MPAMHAARGPAGMSEQEAVSGLFTATPLPMFVLDAGAGRILAANETPSAVRCSNASVGDPSPASAQCRNDRASAAWTRLDGSRPATIAGSRP